MSFLLLFSSKAEAAPPPPHCPIQMAARFERSIYLAAILPEAVDNSSLLKEKKEIQFLLIVRKSWSNFSLGDYIIDTWGYAFHPGCPKNKVRGSFPQWRVWAWPPLEGQWCSQTPAQGVEGPRALPASAVAAIWLHSCPGRRSSKSHCLSPTLLTPGLWSHHHYCFEDHL